MEPAPSADGEIIGYTVYCDRGASASIDAMSPSGRGRDLAFNLGDSFYYEYGPDWSPDGSSLAFAGEHSDEYGAAPADLGSRLAIYVASRANAPSAVARPTTQTDSLGDPAWSPDGVWIAFTRLPDATVNPTTASEIWLVHPDGSGLRRLTDGTPLDGHPAWLPPVRARESGR